MRAFRAVARTGKVVGSCSWAHPHHPRRINTSITQQPKDDSRCIGGNSRNRRQLFVKKNTRFGTRSEYSTRFRLEQINLFCFSDLYAQSRIFIPDFVILINPFHKSPKKLFEYNRKKGIYYGSNNVNHYIVKAASTSDKSHKTPPFSLTLA